MLDEIDINLLCKAGDLLKSCYFRSNSVKLKR